MDEIASLIDGFTEQLRQKMKEFSDGQSIKDSVMGFVHAVDWTEPWLIGVLSFHGLLLLLTLLARKNPDVQTGIFCFTLLAVYLAENLNTVASRHWESFARQNYFDKYGVFTSTVWSGPLIVISIIVLINFMVILTRMMVRWKRAELKHKARKARGKKE